MSVKNLASQELLSFALQPCPQDVGQSVRILERADETFPTAEREEILSLSVHPQSGL